MSHVQVTDLSRVAPWLTKSSFALLSRSDSTVRAAIFIHGFGGHPFKTWDQFPAVILDNPEWADTDAYFLGYSSVSDELSLSAKYVSKFVATIQSVPHSLTSIELMGKSFTLRSNRAEYQ